MTSVGQILDVDLSAGSWRFSAFSGEPVPKYLGGRGINVKYIYDRLIHWVRKTFLFFRVVF
jgi:aldehyde:ferredoxin oxidoreductase